MDDLIYFYGAIALVSSMLTALVLWNMRNVLRQASALILCGVLMVTAYASLVMLLGRPKPLSLEWSAASLKDSTVLAAQFKEEEAIYLWVLIDDASEPLAYRLPWSLDTAKQLQQALQNAESEGTAVKMRDGERRPQDPNEPLFYAAPQKQLPPKVS